MSKLTEDSNALLCTFENSKIGVTFLSFLLLEYHVSTKDVEKYSESIMNFYGFTITQLNSSYSELSFNGYIDSRKDSIRLTKKTDKMFQTTKKPVDPNEIKRIKEAFDKYWAFVPKKINKLKAKRIWDRLKPSENLADNIVDSIEKQVKYKIKMDSLGKFHPELQQPDRWLTNQRWEDVVPEMKSVIKKQKPQRDER
tara:strand:- start:6830 stop:7420 length:591 start_codon:yes stop_codon:yes gene_type:complete